MVDRSKICILDYKQIIKIYNSCQKFTITLKNNYILEIKKRDQIEINKNIFPCSNLIINDIYNKEIFSLNIVDSFEIAGDNIGDRFPIGNSKIPGRHFGKNSYIVLVFITNYNKQIQA